MAIITGTSGDDELRGGPGADRIEGLAGDDVLAGRGGDDILIGGNGIDTMWGGLGDDLYIVEQTGDRAIEGPDAGGWDRVQSAVSYTLGSGIEVLRLMGDVEIDGTGNGLDNVIRGNRQANVLRGRKGDDSLFGGLRDDTLYGGQGNDKLDGGENNDTLYGGDGTDNLFGGKGSDILFGGAGDDILDGGDSGWVSRKIDEVHGGEGNDIITTSGRTHIYFETALDEETNVDIVVDFSTEKLDDFVGYLQLIYLDTSVFAGIEATQEDGPLLAEQFVVADSAQDPAHRIIYNSATGDLFYDSDGSDTGAEQILFANIGPNLTDLTAEQFIPF